MAEVDTGIFKAICKMKVQMEKRLYDDEVEDANCP